MNMSDKNSFEESSPERRLVATGDGSHTIYIPEWEEHYHSIHGALQESLHVFIRSGFDAVAADPCSILEVGMGTGLNAFLTVLEAEQQRRRVHYTALEAFPVAAPLWQSLNYPALLKREEKSNWYALLHTSTWGAMQQISERFHFIKLQQKVQEAIFDAGSFDLVYYDAFAPRVQPELWEADVFAAIYQWMCDGGKLVTYCAKGRVKRTLKAIGFEVESLPGPPGKREMIRAVK